MCGHNTQHNLNPTKNNNDNFIDQIDDGNDSSCTDSEQEDDDSSCDTDNKDCAFNDNVNVICSNKHENDEPDDEIEAENNDEENKNNLESVVEEMEGSLGEKKNRMNQMTSTMPMTQKTWWTKKKKI